ncbi:glycosyltransferase, partial [Acinetobacter baumannii]|nr:glycosyltransferase [Acinetobacter baumannii]
EFYRHSKAARKSNPFDAQRTLARLQNLYPYQTGFTESNLFQFGDVAESDPNLKVNAFAEQWKAMNPGHQYHYLVESDADEIKQTAFEEEIPEVYEAYRLLPKSILKSDFARYLLVFMFGGVYSEIDTKACLPIDDWDPTDSQLLVGISTDNNVISWQHSPV